MNKSIFLLLSLILVTACGIDNGHFKLDGRLLNLNQGEFLIYSPDGAMPHADTIHVEGGRFELISECVHEGTALIIMPNGMEMAVFVKPGASLSLKGDAQNLRMAEITGTKDNEVMNEFRKQVNGKTDNALQPFVKDIILKHPESRIGTYLIRRYILSSRKPDYKAALQLLDAMKKEQEDNIAIDVMRKQVQEHQKTMIGARIPSFSVTDINGKKLTHNDFSKGINVILFWASWDYESLQQVRTAYDILKDKENAKVIGVSLDASIDAAERSVTYDKENWHVVCDGKMTDGAMPRAFAVSQTGTAIIIKDGKVLERTLTGEDLYDKLHKMTE